MSAGDVHDVVIVGAGVAGCLAAWRLARRGVKTLVLEAGPRLSRDDVLKAYMTSADPYASACYADLDYAPRPMTARPDAYHRNEGPDAYHTDYIRAVGGTTWHWGGAALRLSRADMELNSRYGVGRDWPFAYDSLEPWYAQAETELGVAGDDAHDDGAPRTGPFPMPAMPLSVLDREVAQVFAREGIAFGALPQARNSTPYDGRPACAGNNMCNPVCPIGAKYSGDVHAAKAEQAGARIMSQCQVTRLEARDDGTVTAARIRRPDGSEETVRGRVFIIAANGIETPKLLLASASERFSAGLANGSDQVGRNLMGHTDRLLRVEWTREVYAGFGPQTNSCSMAFRDGGFRSARAGALVTVVNFADLGGITGDLLEAGMVGDDLDRAIRARATRRFELMCFAEELPRAHNRVTIDRQDPDSSGQPRIVIHFRADPYAADGADHAAAQVKAVARASGAFQVRSEQASVGSVHILGTAVMGTDPRTSVTNPEGRCHGHPNLFLAGGAVFPSAGTVNPTLTIAALALRTAEAVAAQL